MTNPVFALHNLTNNPSFNFINNLLPLEDSDFDLNSPYELNNFDCQYSDLSNYVKSFANNTNVSIMSLNIQSISAKFSDFKELIVTLSKSNMSPDVICLQELWNFHSHLNFSLPGYSKLIFKLRADGVQGGGVGFFVKTDYKFVVAQKYSIFQDRIFESIFIELTLANNSLVTIGSIYRPGIHPTLTGTTLYENFSEILSNICSSLLDDNKNFYLFGDINIDVLNYNSNLRVTEYVDLLFSYGLLQIITKPTRCTHNSATLIDHVITNFKSDVYKSVIITDCISDHFPVIHFLPSKPIKLKPKTIEKRDFSTQNIELFKTAIELFNWNCVNELPDVQDAYNKFSDTFLTFYNLYFPIKSIKFNKKFHQLEPWVTPGILISRTRKFLLAAIFSKDRSPVNKSAYNVYRNLYNRVLKTAKKLYFDREFAKYKSNLKKTWDTIKFAINSDSKNANSISELFFNGISYTDPQTLADKLNEFFILAPQLIVNEIPSCDENPFPEKISANTFSLRDSPVTKTEILDAVSQLQNKKSEDMYGISMFIVKKLISALITPLFFIISKSFESGKIPQQLKIAKIIPIFKAGDKLMPDNYRPISLLPNFSKVLEKVMSNRLTLFLESNNLLCNEQFGFRKGHSTLHPLVHFLNHVAEAKNANKYTISIFCDLKKAFDTVNHKILLKKLSNIGVRGVELEWFADYLSNRKQFVHINGKNSTLLEIILGVPQGSILGPLLFLIYINDLPDCNSLKNSLFADDTSLLESHESLPVLVSKINTEFQKVITYFKINKLALHLDKTKFIVFFQNKGTPSPNIVFNYNNLNTPTLDPALIFPMACVNDLAVPKIKFLGVQIDPFLNFKEHLQLINNKLSTGLFFLRTVRNFLNEKALKYLYYSLVHCHIIYAIHIYSSASESLLKSIFLKQKNAIRIITGSKYNAHTEPLFKKLKIIPFPKLCEFFKIQFMQNFSQNFLPISFHDTWVTNRSRRQNAALELRNDDELYVPFSRNNFISRLPLALFPKLWTEFPSDEIKFIRNKLEFNLKLKNFYIDQLSEIPICGRLLCPHCHL